MAELDKVALPYHLDAAKQVAGRLALRFGDEMETRVKHVVAERERVAAALGPLPVEAWPSGANFVLFRPTPSGRPGGLARAARPIRPGPGLLRLAPARRAACG